MDCPYSLHRLHRQGLKLYGITAFDSQTLSCPRRKLHRQTRAPDKGSQTVRAKVLDHLEHAPVLPNVKDVDWVGHADGVDRPTRHDDKRLTLSQWGAAQQATPACPEGVRHLRSLRYHGAVGQVHDADPTCGHLAYGPPEMKPYSSGTDGARMAMNKAGKIKNTSGKSILTAALWASSSAR